MVKKLIFLLLAIIGIIGCSASKKYYHNHDNGRYYNCEGGYCENRNYHHRYHYYSNDNMPCGRHHYMGNWEY